MNRKDLHPKFFFISNSDSGGGIAFNVKKINKELLKLGMMSSCVFLNKKNLSNFITIIDDKGSIYLFSTSVISLFYANLLFLIRCLFFRRTYISQIIYHPRFIDPDVSFFRKILRYFISKLPDKNIFYFSDESVNASRITKLSELNSNNLIGLCSIYKDIASEEISLDGIDYHNKFVISTVSRFVDFKLGYLIDLINYAKFNEGVILLIVGYGEHEYKLKELSDSSPNIFFLGKLNINQSKYIVEKSDLYVGMGTTLVDAFNINIPAITAIESSTEGLTNGFFGINAGFNFGEYMPGVNYYNLATYINDNIGSLRKVNKKSTELVEPWEKIINSHLSIMKISLLTSIFITFGLFLTFVVKFFDKKDYH